MSTANPQPAWAIIGLGEDLNWWIQDICEDFHGATDGFGIIDPNQIAYIIDLCEPLSEYGFDMEIFDGAFYKFCINKELKNGGVGLVQIKGSLLESDEKLFALPGIVDEGKGPYIDFLERVTKLRVKLLNDLIDLDHNLTPEEIEEEIRERQDKACLEGRPVHFFNELTAILEYVPEGYELDMGDSALTLEKKDDLDDFLDVEEEAVEGIEEDETMRWDEEDEAGIEKPRRGRPPKK